MISKQGPDPPFPPGRQNKPVKSSEKDKRHVMIQYCTIPDRDRRHDLYVRYVQYVHTVPDDQESFSGRYSS